MLIEVGDVISWKFDDYLNFYAPVESKGKTKDGTEEFYVLFFDKEGLKEDWINEKDVISVYKKKE